MKIFWPFSFHFTQEIAISVLLGLDQTCHLFSPLHTQAFPPSGPGDHQVLPPSGAQPTAARTDLICSTCSPRAFPGSQVIRPSVWKLADWQRGSNLHVFTVYTGRKFTTVIKPQLKVIQTKNSNKLLWIGSKSASKRLFSSSVNVIQIMLKRKLK